MSEKIEADEFRRQFDELFDNSTLVPTFSFALKGNSGKSKIKAKFYQADGVLKVLRYKGPYQEGLELHDHINSKVRARLAANPPTPPA